MVCGRRDLSLDMCLLDVCIRIWLYARYLDMLNVALFNVLYFGFSDIKLVASMKIFHRALENIHVYCVFKLTFNKHKSLA